MFRLVRHSIVDSYSSDSPLDLLYIVFVFITFLPTVIIPWFYAHWVLIGRLEAFEQ